MNVTVVIPPSLGMFVGGRRAVELGVPVTADLGDVLQSLFLLYPRLHALQADERFALRKQLQLVMDDTTFTELAKGRSGLREGKKLFLSGWPPKPAPEQVGASEG
jgi:hypothetical protein